MVYRFQLLVFILLLNSWGLSAQTIYVDSMAGGNNTGVSWTDASANLMDALSVAVDGDEIWVASGNYTPGPSRSDNIEIISMANISIYGGFLSGAANLMDRNWVDNPTILSGEIGSAANTDNSYHVVGISNSENIILDGLIIEGGYGDGLTLSDNTGAGLFIKQSSTVIENCIVRYNYCTYIGAGIEINAIGKQNIIRNSVIENNTASIFGGGIWEDSNVTHENVVFYNNISLNAGFDGGGVYINNGTALVDFINCTFVNNQANRYGGAIRGHGTTDVKNSVFWNNSALTSGNAIYDAGAVSLTYSYSAFLDGIAGSSPTDNGNNFIGDPMLQNLGMPSGADGLWFTDDDGLQPMSGSNLIDSGDNGSNPGIDIRGKNRDDGFVDMGAYEYVSTTGLVLEDDMSFTPPSSINQGDIDIIVMEFKLAGGSNIEFIEEIEFNIGGNVLDIAQAEIYDITSNPVLVGTLDFGNSDGDALLDYLDPDPTSSGVNVSNGNLFFRGLPLFESYPASTNLLELKISISANASSDNLEFGLDPTSLTLQGGNIVTGDSIFTGPISITAGGNGNGLIGHWPLNEGTGLVIGDLSTYVNGGYIYGGGNWSAGISGNALGFDGVNDYVDIPAISAYDNLSQFSISLWIRPDTLSGQQGLFQRWPHLENDRSIGVYLNNNGVNVTLDSDGAGATNADLGFASGNLSAGIWQHVTATWDGNEVKVYLDGNVMGNLVYSSNIHNSSANIILGARLSNYNSGYELGYQGAIQDVKFFNYALSPAEVLTEMNEINAGSGINLLATGFASPASLPNSADNIQVLEFKLENNGSTLETLDSVLIHLPQGNAMGDLSQVVLIDRDANAILSNFVPTSHDNIEFTGLNYLMSPSTNLTLGLNVMVDGSPISSSIEFVAEEHDIYFIGGNVVSGGPVSSMSISLGSGGSANLNLVDIGPAPPATLDSNDPLTKMIEFEIQNDSPFPETLTGMTVNFPGSSPDLDFVEMRIYSFTSTSYIGTGTLAGGNYLNSEISIFNMYEPIPANDNLHLKVSLRASTNPSGNAYFTELSTDNIFVASSNTFNYNFISRGPTTVQTAPVSGNLEFHLTGFVSPTNMAPNDEEQVLEFLIENTGSFSETLDVLELFMPQGNAFDDLGVTSLIDLYTGNILTNGSTVTSDNLDLTGINTVIPASGNVLFGVNVQISAAPVSGLVEFEVHSDTAGFLSSNVVNNSSVANSGGISISSGNIDYALEFDGTNDHVFVPGQASLEFTGDITVEGWLYVDSATSAQRIIVDKVGEPGSGPGYFVYLTIPHHLSFWINDSSASTLSTSDPVPLDEWFHFAVTYDSINHYQRIFINGLENSSKFTTAGVGATNGANLFIGSHRNGTNYFDGKIDELAIWNEVRDEASLGYPLVGTEPNLIAYYNFNEGSGLFLGDLVASAIGNVNNGATWVNSGVNLMILPEFLDLLGTNPNHFEIDVPTSGNISLFFSEDIVLTGNGFVDFEQVFNSVIDDTQTSANMFVSGNQLNVSYSNLNPYTQYSINITNDLIEGLSGNLFRGYSDNLSWVFDTGAGGVSSDNLEFVLTAFMAPSNLAPDQEEQVLEFIIENTGPFHETLDVLEVFLPQGNAFGDLGGATQLVDLYTGNVVSNGSPTSSDNVDLTGINTIIPAFGNVMFGVNVQISATPESSVVEFEVRSEKAGFASGNLITSGAFVNSGGISIDSMMSANNIIFSDNVNYVPPSNIVAGSVNVDIFNFNLYNPDSVARSVNTIEIETLSGNALDLVDVRVIWFNGTDLMNGTTRTFSHLPNGSILLDFDQSPLFLTAGANYNYMVIATVDDPTREADLHLRIDPALIVSSNGDAVNGVVADYGSINLDSSVGASGNFTSVAIGMHHALFVKQGELFAVGMNDFSALGNVSSTAESFPIQIGVKTDWVQVGVSSGHSIAVDSVGGVYGWGTNFYDRLGSLSSVVGSPSVMFFTGTGREIAVSESATFILDDQNDFYGVGRNQKGQLGNGAISSSNSIFMQLSGIGNITAYSVGVDHGLAVVNGDLYAWGSDGFGQLGTNAVSDYSAVPVLVDSVNTWIDVEAGGFHSFGITDTNQVFTWGKNTKGQLCDSMISSSVVEVPSQLTSLPGTISEISAGIEHTMMLFDDGRVFVGGSNVEHQGTTNSENDLDELYNFMNAEAIEAGPYSSSAIFSSNVIMKGRAFDGSTLFSPTVIAD